MTRLYWTTDGTDGPPSDLQQTPDFNPISSQARNLNSPSPQSSLVSDECVATLLRSWGRSQQAIMVKDVSIDVWSQIASKLVNPED